VSCEAFESLDCMHFSRRE